MLPGRLGWHFESYGLGFSPDLLPIAFLISELFPVLGRGSGHGSFPWEMGGRISTVHASCDIAESLL